MIDFKVPVLQDKLWAEDILKFSGYYGSDCSFGTIYIWSDVYKIKISKYKNFLLRMYGENDIYYGFPLGDGDLNSAIEYIENDAYQRKIEFKLFGITDKMKNILESKFNGKFEFESDRDIADYLYNSSDLILLSGKKYHTKRNHISKFNRLYEWEYEDICDINMEDCKKFIDNWFKDNIKIKGNNIEKEYKVISKVLNDFKNLGLIGGILKVSGKVIALTIGEEINKECFLIHFEKADYSYDGAYTVINNEFCLRNLKMYKYINREEDMGIEGLRKAKLSYHPQILLSKYKAILKV